MFDSKAFALAKRLRNTPLKQAIQLLDKANNVAIGGTALELVDQVTLAAMWELGPEAQQSLLRFVTSGGSDFLSRLSDTSIQVAASDKSTSDADKQTLHDHIVQRWRRALYRLVIPTYYLALFDSKQDADGCFYWVSGEPIDPHLLGRTADHLFEVVRKGGEVQQEVELLIYLEQFTSEEVKAFLRTHYREMVALLGNPDGLIEGEYDALNVLKRAGFAVHYRVASRGSTLEAVQRFNRLVIPPNREFPDTDLLLKVGSFGWKIRAARMDECNGGVPISDDNLDSPSEYRVFHAIDPREWEYVSDDGDSRVVFRKAGGIWVFEGEVTLGCLRLLYHAGLVKEASWGSVAIPLDMLFAAIASMQANSAR